LRKWLSKRRKLYCKSILSIVEKTFLSSSLFSASAKWHEVILRTQRSLRFILFIRRKLYSKLTRLWDNTESLFFQKIHIKKRKLPKSPKKPEPERFSSIPEEIKRYFLLKLIKEKYSPYIEQCSNHSRSCKAIDELNAAREFEINLEMFKKIRYPDKPKKVFLLKVIHQDDLKDLIQEAQIQRNNWNEILSKITQKVRKSGEKVQKRRRFRNF
jgi:hypothetical protein